MADFIIHAISCLCVDFKERSVIKEQVFAVCSEIDDKGLFIPHFAQCPNCGNVHNVYDIGKSRLHGKDESSILPNIEELELMIPGKVARLLKANRNPVYVWQAVFYIFKHKLFPNIVLLSQEEKQEPNKQVPTIVSKMLIIDDEDSYKIVMEESDPLQIAQPL